MGARRAEADQARQGLGEVVKPGEIVKFKQPFTPEEATERFVVIENRVERTLVRAEKGFETWAIKPTFVYATTDLEIA